jgi:hypothetical protein
MIGLPELLVFAMVSALTPAALPNRKSGCAKKLINAKSSHERAFYAWGDLPNALLFARSTRPKRYDIHTAAWRPLPHLIALVFSECGLRRFAV